MESNDDILVTLPKHESAIERAYREIREQYESGKRLECKSYFSAQWADYDGKPEEMDWNAKEYRIKPVMYEGRGRIRTASTQADFVAENAQPRQSGYYMEAIDTCRPDGRVSDRWVYKGDVYFPMVFDRHGMWILIEGVPDWFSYESIPCRFRWVATSKVSCADGTHSFYM